MIVSLMLIAAVTASLALGVLVAYGLCQMMFQMFRVHAISASRDHVGSAGARATVKS